MSSPQNNDQHKSSEGCQTLSPNMLMHHQHQHPHQHQQQQQQHLLQMQQQMQNFQKQQQQQQDKQKFDSESSLTQKRNLYAIKEQEENEDEPEIVENEQQCHKSEVLLDNAYDADVDDDIPMRSVPVVVTITECCVVNEDAQMAMDKKQHIYELFQPWALKTYGDQAKTKTITMRKKIRILKALEGKEHSRPDSSKFRFWVKSKGFTTNRPESFEDAPCTKRLKKPLPPNAVLSDNPADVDLYVASTNKDFEKRHYRQVAVVEEFFDIIYNIHMELGGRSGMHAGQKRTYRIISETYAFLPREAVTRFLSICPECKKNLRPSSPSSSSAHLKEDAMIVTQNESSSEVEVLNYSSHTESSLEGRPSTKTLTKSTSTSGAVPLAQAKKRRYSNPDNNSKASVAPSELGSLSQSLPRRYSSPVIASTSGLSLSQNPTNLPKIRVNPNLQRPFTPTVSETSAFAQPHYGYGFDFHSLKSRENLVRYYDFMRRLYAGNLPMTPANTGSNLPPPPPIFNKDILPKFIKAKPENIFPKETFLKNLESSISSSSSCSEDDGDNVTVLTAKRFKSSAESSEKTKALESPLLLQIPTIDKDFIQTTQIRAINLSKNSSNFSSPISTQIETKIPTTPVSAVTTSFAATLPLTSTPTSIKKESVTPPKASSLATTLRIPQHKTFTELPPIDFERLKPITSTYLQLTRSMGLSDEEALRFDNLVSKDFKYSL